MGYKTLEATACHEAGHAVAHYWLKVPFRFVSIEPSKSYLGRVEGYKPPESIRPDYENDWRTRQWVERHVMIAYAGGVAVKHVLGRRVTGLGSDNQAVVSFLSYVSGSDEQLYAYSKWLLTRTVDLFKLSHIQTAVHALMHELLQRETIRQREAKQIIQGAILSRVRRAPDAV